MTELDLILEKKYYSFNINDNDDSYDDSHDSVNTNEIEIDLEFNDINHTNSITDEDATSSEVVRLASGIGSSTDYLFNNELILHRYPYYTIFITIVNCPISPPNQAWYFETISDWEINMDSCDSLKDDYWRLISFQFVHASLMHLFGNTGAILCYGLILESQKSLGIFKTFAIYQTAVIMGALGHSYIWPYIGIIGASPGGYGLIGGCWVHCILNTSGVNLPGLQQSKLAIRVVLAALLSQLIYDIVSYVFYYNSTISYAAHAFGFYTGVTLCLSYNISPIRNHPKKAFIIVIAGWLGLAGFLLVVVFLCYQYYHNFPPTPFIREWLHNTDQATVCCAKLFEYMEISKLSKEQVLEITVCRNDKLYIL